MAKPAIHDLDALKRYLGQSAPFQGGPTGRETGIAALDRLLARGGGGLPRGALTLVGGAPGSGRASLVAHVLARETADGRPVAWVDARGTLYPPALVDAGVDPERLLLVRSDPERALYAAEQLLASGVLRLVGLSGLGAHLVPRRARRLQSAAESGGASALVLIDEVEGRAQDERRRRATPVPAAALELSVQRKAGGALVTVVRDRAGPSGRRALVPLADARPARLEAVA